MANPIEPPPRELIEELAVLHARRHLEEISGAEFAALVAPLDGRIAAIGWSVVPRYWRYDEESEDVRIKIGFEVLPLGQ